jgi:hypothetical protein
MKTTLRKFSEMGIREAERGEFSKRYLIFIICSHLIIVFIKSFDKWKDEFDRS